MQVFKQGPHMLPTADFLLASSVTSLVESWQGTSEIAVKWLQAPNHNYMGSAEMLEQPELQDPL